MKSERTGKRLQRAGQPAGPVLTLEGAYEEIGPKAIATVRDYDPSAYVGAIALLVRDLD